MFSAVFPVFDLDNEITAEFCCLAIHGSPYCVVLEFVIVRRMETLDGLGSWITEHEALLSGLSAMIVLLGVFISPIGRVRKRYLKQRESDSATEKGPPNAEIQLDPSHSTPDAIHRRLTPPKTGRLTFKALTAPSPHPVQFAQSDGARLAYNERGTGPISVMLTLGIICHLNVSENLPVIRGTLDALSTFARVITFDKRGQGLSDPALRVPDFEQRSRDIAAVMDAAGLTRAHLLALSEGGPMALHFAWRYPERVLGLILVGTTARFMQSEDFPIGIQRDLLELIPEVWGSGEMRDILMPSLSRETMDDATYRSMEQLIASRETARQLTETMIATDLRSILPEIRCPALVLHFVGDLAIPIRLGRALAEGLPNAEFVEVNSVDHADISQSPDAIERIRQFCERTSIQRADDARGEQ